MASERAPSDTAALRRAGNLLREIASTEGQSGKAVQKVRFLNDLAKDLKAHAIGLSKRLNPLAALRCLCIPITSANGAARAGAYRALRYLMVTQELHDAVLDMRVDVFIVRSMDQDANKETERLQAVKLVRSMMLLQPLNFPLSFARVLVAVAESAQDNLAQSALAVLCELTVLNSHMASICGGIRAIHMGIVANHSNVMLQRIQKAYGTTLAVPAPLTEFMTLSLLRLYNGPDTRCYLRQDVELETLLAPLLDVHYKHSAESADGTSQQAMNEKTAHINASQMAVLTMFRTWQGLMYLARPSDKSPLQALIDVLPYPDETLQIAVLNVLFGVFHLKTPIETEDFGEALATISPSGFQEEWQLDQGWLAEEGRALLQRSGTRVNMMDQYHAVVLQAFLSRGLLERLVEVTLSQLPQVSTRATILLGELLHMANTFLPVELACSTHCLAELVAVATNFQGSDERRNRANSVINNLDFLHQRKKDPMRPNSLFLEQIVQQAKSAEGEKRKVARVADWSTQDMDDAQLATSIRDTNVTQEREYSSWNFQIIAFVLKLPNISLKRLEDQHPKFIKRLLAFFRPTSSEYVQIPATQENIRKYSTVGLQLVSCLMTAYSPPEEPPKGLSELLSEVIQNITLVTKHSEHARASIFSSTSLVHTLARDYFLFVGKLSSTSAGCQLLEKCNAFREFLEIPELEDREDLQRLLISSLDYSRDGPSRIILSKLLTNTSKEMRLYSTSHLRVLHRAKVPFFQTWCMEMLVTQLYDPCAEVADEALNVLDEVCEDESCLHTLVTLQPSLLHLGSRGRSLFMRFASIGIGLRFLKSQDLVSAELDRWFETENAAYVSQLELRISQAFTGFKLQPEGQYTRRSCTDRPLAESRELWVPVHFYGQLVQQRDGFEVLLKTGHIEALVDVLATSPCDPSKLLDVKSAIWALCHLGAKLWGLKVLVDSGAIARIIELLETTGICTLKGSCILALSLLASTPQGCEALTTFGYQCVRHASDALWPVSLPPSSTCDVTVHQPVGRTYSDNVDTGSTSESGDELSPDGSTMLMPSGRPVKRSLSSVDSRYSSMSVALSTNSIVDDLDAFSPDDPDGSMQLSAPTTRVQSLRSFNSTASVVNVSSSASAASLGGGRMARKKASNSLARKGSLQMPNNTAGGFVGVCLPADINNWFKLPESQFTGSLAETLTDPVGLRFDTFHGVKDCLLCLHTPVPTAELFEAAQLDLEESTERGPQEMSNMKPKDSSEEGQPDMTTFDGQLQLRRNLMAFIARLSGAVGSRNNQTQILNYKDKHPSLFKDVCLYSQVGSLLEFYHFRVHVRRFIQHLFDEVDFAAIFRGNGRPSLPELLMITAS